MYSYKGLWLFPNCVIQLFASLLCSHNGYGDALHDIDFSNNTRRTLHKTLDNNIDDNSNNLYNNNNYNKTNNNGSNFIHNQNCNDNLTQMLETLLLQVKTWQSTPISNLFHFHNLETHRYIHSFYICYWILTDEMRIYLFSQQQRFLRAHRPPQPKQTCPSQVSRILSRIFIECKI